MQLLKILRNSCQKPYLIKKCRQYKNEMFEIKYLILGVIKNVIVNIQNQ